MKVKIVNPDNAPGLIDPHTKRQPFVDSASGQAILEAVDVPDTHFWVRRVLAGEIKRVDQPEPTGREPVLPLTTR